MKVIFNKVSVVLLSFAMLTGCSSSDSDAAATTTPAETDAAQAVKTATAAVPGTAATPTKIDTADEHRWAVDITLSNGAVVTVEIARSSGEIEEIKGEKGPFDYEIAPPKPGLMTFSQAKQKAFGAKMGAVEVWEVKPPTNLYEIYVRDTDEHLWEIKMTADKGDVTSVLEKTAAD